MTHKRKTPGGGNRNGGSENDGRNRRIQYTPIYSESGQVIAKVMGDELLKNIRGSKHMLKQPPAIGFDECALEQAKSAGALKVRVVDQETGVIYRAKLEQFWRDGIHINRGFGNQVVLPLAGWTQQKKGGGLQLSMFEGGRQ